MPNDNSKGVGGHPRLYWNLPGENLLTNGGFEQGDTGWVLVGNLSFKAGVLTNSVQKFEGTNIAHAIALRTKVTLPVTQDRFIWSFATSTRIDGVAVEVLTNDPGSKTGFSVAKRADLSQMVILNSPWGVYSLDISEFSGEVLTLQLRSLVEAGTYPIDVDDVRVTVEPSDFKFNVSFNGVTLGQTTNNWWQLDPLLENKTYAWQIDAIENGATNSGPLWHFTTPYAGTPDQIWFADTSPLICPNVPVTFESAMLDTLGRVFASPPNFVFTAYAQNAAVPTVLISEIDTGPQDAVEFINAGTNTINLSNWYVQILAPSNSTPVLSLRLPNQNLAPGEIFVVSEGVPNNWPQLGMQSINWGDSGALQAGVILRNAGSNLIDCAFIDLTAETNAFHFMHLRSVSPLDWRSNPITTPAAGQTYQRIGNLDVNLPADWQIAPGSIGSINSAMQIPFDLSFGRLNTLVTNLHRTNGMSFPTMSFPRPLNEVTIAASVRPNINNPPATGYSLPFDVSEPAFCLSILGPQEIREDSGATEYRIVLGAPPTQDIIVTLNSSHPEVASFSANVTIPAGTTEAIVNLQAIQNDNLEGRKFITLTANADNYTPVSLPVTVLDDETATLTIVASPSVLEDVDLIEIRSTAAPSVNVPINVMTDPYRGKFVPVLMAGHTNTTFKITNDFGVTGNLQLHLTAQFDDWTPGAADILLIDNTSATLALTPPAAPVQEAAQSTTATVSLISGFAAPTGLEISLVSSEPNLLIVPSQVVMHASFNSATFLLFVPANDLPAGPRSVNVTASVPGLPDATIAIPIYLNPPGARLQIALTVDGSVVIHFNAESDSDYFVLDGPEPQSPPYDGITPQISNGIGEIRLTPQDQSRFVVVIRVPEQGHKK